MRGACNALKSLTGDKPAAQIPWRQRSQPELANKATCAQPLADACVRCVCAMCERARVQLPSSKR